MLYPEDFKQKVISVLGDNETIIKGLDSGSEIIGRYLNDSSYLNISAKEIVDAFEKGDINDIYLKAKRKLIIEELYREWIDLYQCFEYEESHGEYLDSVCCNYMKLKK